jgi:hypothetical protein
VRIRGPLPHCETVLERLVRRGASGVRVPTARTHDRPLRRGRYLVEIVVPGADVVARRILVVPHSQRRARLLRLASRTPVAACVPAAAQTSLAGAAAGGGSALGAEKAAGPALGGEKTATGAGGRSAAPLPPPPSATRTNIVSARHHSIPRWVFAVVAAWAAVVAVLVVREDRPRRYRPRRRNA